MFVYILFLPKYSLLKYSPSISPPTPSIDFYYLIYFIFLAISLSEIIYFYLLACLFYLFH